MSDEPCPHDCAVGIGTVTTSIPPWSGAIWECTVCHVIGEDAPDGTVIWGGSGMSDRDELTDRDALTKIIHDLTCRAGAKCYKPRDIHNNIEDPQRIADAVIAAGWVHWPHDCDTEAELIAQWAHTSFETMAELHRLRTENAALRRRLVEAGALDPSESVGE